MQLLTVRGKTTIALYTALITGTLVITILLGAKMGSESLKGVNTLTTNPTERFIKSNTTLNSLSTNFSITPESQIIKQANSYMSEHTKNK